MPNDCLNRRSVLVSLAALAGVPALRNATAATLPQVKVNRDPSCGCCGAWVDHMRQAGFLVEVIETSELNRVRAKLGVPQALAACHTAEVGGYVIEGHVPAAAVKRLLTEKPQGKGLAVPGMPVGSPGMEMEGTEPETYDVVLFGPDGQRTFGRYRGEQQV